MSEATRIQKDKLMADLQAVLADTEALLAATANDASAGVVELRGRVQASLTHARADLLEAQQAVIVRAREAAKATEGYVRLNPWKAVGMAAGAGLLIGLLLKRR
jgi:ElaB/YqjD/DUF883 family membrane-anchored ribosome-binding protein